MVVEMVAAAAEEPELALVEMVEMAPLLLPVPAEYAPTPAAAAVAAAAALQVQGPTAVLAMQMAAVVLVGRQMAVVRAVQAAPRLPAVD